MKHISLPKKFIVEESSEANKAKVIIEPCFPGYGLTLGNALRRVLLSSLPGGAVTAVKFHNASHEFTTIENVSEDVMNIVLSLKQLNVKVHSDEPVVLKLKASGEKKITAKDIEGSSDVDITNEDLHIATLNDKDATLEMDITVAKGVGYVPAEDQSDEKGEIGVILIDSIFSPIVNVGLDVEETRVGQQTNYDKVILDIETDGSINAGEATQKAAEILVNQLSWVMEGGTRQMEEVDLEAPVDLPEVEDEPEEEVEAPAETEEEETKDEEIEEEKPKKRGRPKKTE